MTDKRNLKQRLSEGIFFLDGAMGTQLIARQVPVGKCNELLNIELPQIIMDIHRSYFEAGSDAVLTNTFGANEVVLARHGLADKLERINRTAAEVARKVAGEDRYVIGDIGPCGKFLKPLGDLEPAELKTAFASQARALYDGGVDGFIIETFTSVEEARLAIEAVKSVCQLPVFVSFAFDPAAGDFKTMMGLSVERIVSEVSSMDVDAIGFNCGTLRMEQYVMLAEKFARLLQTRQNSVQGKGANRILLLAEPNAGKPELVDGRAVYKVSPAEFAVYAQKIYKAGATIIGGCCGTGPEHIKAVTEKLKNF